MRRRRSTCKCPNHGAARRLRWRVIERRKLPATSRLKCLACGWKWWSRCKYVAKLADHRERAQNGVTEQCIIDRIAQGTLDVCLTTAIVKAADDFKDKKAYRRMRRKLLRACGLKERKD
jgi:hypothetical protein